MPSNEFKARTKVLRENNTPLRHIQRDARPPGPPRSMGRNFLSTRERPCIVIRTAGGSTCPAATRLLGKPGLLHTSHSCSRVTPALSWLKIYSYEAEIGKRWVLCMYWLSMVVVEGGGVGLVIGIQPQALCILFAGVFLH